MFPCDLILASQHVFTGQLYFNTFFYNIPSLYTSPVHNSSQFKIQNSDWASKLNYDFDFDKVNTTIPCITKFSLTGSQLK